MHVPAASHPPKQERSRRTLARLLAATIWTLDEVGLDEATIPRIAGKAGVAPATIYRRFEDKQALLRAAFLHMLERGNQANRGHLQARLADGRLEQAAHVLVEMFLGQFRKHARLMHAMDRFLETDDDAGFVAAAQDMEEANLEQYIQAMLLHRAEISHPDPERAVRIATLTVLTAIRMLTLRPRTLWRTAQPEARDALSAELTRTYLAYLTSGA